MIDPRREYLPEWLRQRTELTGSRLAVIADGVRWTYRELDERATFTAGQLAALGVKAGNRVAVLSWNCPEFVVVVHALGRLQATLVPLNARLSEVELAWQMDDADARLLVHDAFHAEIAEALARNRGGLMTARFVEPGDQGALAGIDAVDASLCVSIALDHPRSIIYTSGTTGQPKGAVLTNGNYWWSAIGSALNLGLHEDDCWLACLPLFHVGGLSIVFRSVIYGTRMVIQQGFTSSAVNRAIDAERVTIISVVSTMLQRMLDDRGDRRYPESLRCVLIGGGPVPEPLLDRAERLGVPLVQTYGLTETASQIATLAPEDARRKRGSAGKALFPSELQIVRDGDKVGPGEVGEIVVRGPSVTTGYVNRPDATAGGYRDGWFQTGDLGYLDDEGYLFVVDRRDDLIVTGGENVYPAEVESVLLAHPAVEEAGVVGVPDPTWGQVPVAVLKLRPGYDLTIDEVQSFCRRSLAGYKVPKEVRILDLLPRNATGKLMRRALRNTWGEGGP